MAWGVGWWVAWPTPPSALHAHQVYPLPRLLFRFLLLLLLLDADGSSSADASDDLSRLWKNYSVTIYENSLPRTYVAAKELMGIRLKNLPPKSQVSYAIVEGDERSFFTAESEVIGDVAVLQIRTRTGLHDVLNRERQSLYILSVEARIRNSRHGSIRRKLRSHVTLTVLDINDNMPLFYPESYEVSIGEDVSLHTQLISVMANDADIGYNGQVYYSLENPGNDYFAIHPSTGVVSVTRPLSHITGHAHQIRIVAQDRGLRPRILRSQLRASATVEVMVNRVNMHSPVISVQHLPHVIEHSHAHIYAIIKVDDADEGNNGIVDKIDIIGGDPRRLFSITPSSHPKEYNLVVLHMLDLEVAQERFNLTIQASDFGTPPRKTIMNVPVVIISVTDYTPVFAQEQYEEAVTEEAPPNTPVVNVATFDIDDGSSSKVHFRIVAGNEDKKFHINTQTGLLSTAEWLDHENTAYYSLTVTAVDQTSNARRKQSSVKVVIRILDANDNTPEFNTPNTEVTLDENEPIGTYVTRVVATDLDSGENGFISYSIANLDQVPFTIDSFDGTVRTSSVLDYETQRRVYTIKVRASDWGIPFKRETETTIKVKVRDINDNPPQFEGVDCKGWVSVNAPIGTSVFRVSAIDLDANSHVRYKLHRDISEECWAMDVSSGVLSLTCDLEKIIITAALPKTYILNITASDGTLVSDPANIAIAVITDFSGDQSITKQYSHVDCHNSGIGAKASEIISAASVNNAANEHYAPLPLRYGYNAHAPELPETFPFAVEIPENTEPGTEVIRIVATDHDHGHNGRVVYSVSNGDIDSVFKIHYDSGMLILWRKLDHERVSEYVLNITVYDLGVPHKSTSRNLTIQVSDVNDNAPKFSSLSYRSQISENTPNGTSVTQVIAHDADEGINAKVYYKLITEVKEFTVDRDTGILYVISSLDRERRNEYDLKIQAWDSSEENPCSTIARILVKVLDVNDCPPEFGASKYLSVDLPEDYPIGAVITTFHATDRDLDINGQISYTLGDHYNHAFRIDDQTGVVRVAATLDYEARQSYNITIRAQDKGTPPLESFATLFVRLHDLDENLGPPIFTKRIVRGWVQENQVPGALVTKVTALDPDDGQLHYSIVSGSGLGYFTVDKEGTVRSTVTLDREAARGYWLSITVADNGTVPLTDICHVYVEVQDINDHVPQTKEPRYKTQVPEDAAPGTQILELKATDGDLAPSNLTFVITGGNEDAHFEIDPVTGVLTTAWTLDRETQPLYEILVTVSDGRLSSVTYVTVVVTDANDNAPEFLENVYRITVPSTVNSSRRASLFRVFARDVDAGRNGQLDYRLKASPGSRKFVIHPKTGDIYTKDALVPGQTYEVTIQARDNGRPRLSSTTRVLARVVPVAAASSHAPQVTPPSGARVMETDPPGHMVTLVEAHDMDNDTLWYYIVDGDNRGRFSIGIDTGMVTVARRADHVDVAHYSLTIEVTDGFHTTATQLTIEVTPSSSHQPEFSLRLYEGIVSEGAEPGKSVLAVRCRDKDHATSVDSPALIFTLHHTDSLASRGLFAVDSSTGDVVVAKPLNREVSSSHLLTVSCRVKGRREIADFARVNLTVIDANDHDPTFFEDTIDARISYGSSAGTEVTKVLAIDHDKGDNGRLTYSIVEGNAGGVFTVETSLGLVRLARKLTTSDPREFLLLVRAMDHGKEPRSASVPVRVTITSPIENPLEWEMNTVNRRVEVSEWAPVGSAVARVAASWPLSVQYTITEGNHEGTFAISPASGVVTLATELDFEAISWYNLTLTGTNLAGAQRSTWLGISVLDENDWWPEWNEAMYRGIVEWNAAANDPVLLYPELSEIGLPELSKNTIPEFSGSGLAEPSATYLPEASRSGLSEMSGNTFSKLSGSYLPEMSRSNLTELPGIGLSEPSESYLPKASGSNFPEPLSLIASDRDSGPNGRILYSIVEDNVAQYFTIDRHTGTIRVSGSLKDIAGTTVSFSVWATDGGKPMRECIAPATVTISIRSKPILPVAFTQAHYSAELHLPTYVGVRILCVRPQSDRKNPKEEPPEDDALRNFEYSVGSGDEPKRFTMVRSSGCLYVNNHHDLKEGRYNLTLRATDSTRVSTAFASIIVKEAPTSGLAFTQEKYFAKVFENSTKELNVVAVKVKGQALDHQIEYSILNPTSTFEIKRTAGVIKTTGTPLDRELKDQYTLVIQAKDVGDPAKFAHVLVHVAVMDLNDNSPIFLNQPYASTVSTKTKRGHVIAKVRAVDADAEDFGLVRYELVRGNGELFAVDKKSGRISLKQDLTVTNATYSLTVAAYDGGKQPLSSQASVVIRVISSEDPAFSLSSYHASVKEDSPVGTPLVRVEADNPSAGAIIYTIIAGNSEGAFFIGHRTGILQTSSILDYETTRVHNLTVRARDPNTGRHAETQVTVFVTDVNDNAPVFVERVIRAQVSEVIRTGHLVVQVEAHDVDKGAGGDLRYSCDTGCDLFSVGTQDGIIRVTGSLDAETHQQHVLTVTATDMGLPRRSSSATVVIEVLDFNDNPPQWRQDTYTCRLSPESSPGHVVLALSAHDPDVGQQGRPLRYAIHSGNKDRVFRLNELTGVLAASSPHKLLNVPSLKLNVSVNDGVHIAFTSVHVEVLPYNHSPPRLRRSTYEVGIQENVSDRRFVLALDAEDRDPKEYGMLKYSIIDQTLRDAFSIDKDGNIFAESSLDREALSAHTIHVSVADGGGRASVCSVRVSVLDENDNGPKFKLPSYQANINTDVDVGTVILKVQATDLDEGVNSEIEYQIYGDTSTSNILASSLFDVNKTTGELVLSSSVRGKENEVYQFFIRGEDGGYPRRHSDVPVTVILLPPGVPMPQCPQKYAQFFVREDASVGSIITTLWKRGPQDVIYSLYVLETGFTEDGAEESLDPIRSLGLLDPLGSSGPFSVTPEGQVVILRPLDREKDRLYTITVTNRTLTTPPYVDYMTLSIVVTDVNDCAPIFSRPSYESSVAENSGVGDVVTIVSATDGDEGMNGQIQYFLSSENDDAAKSTFRLDPHTGYVTLASPLDREVIPVYSFTVVATDGGPTPFTDTAEVKVIVIDYNDNPPFFSKKTYLTAVPEDTATGTAILELVVDDTDEVTGRLDYFVTGGDLGDHFLVHASGQLYVAAPLDREKQDEYSLMITVTDGKFSTNTTVIVTVIDVNDNGPECEEPFYKTEISEGVEVGTSLVSIESSDPDEGPAARSRYVLSGKGAEDFSVDKGSGRMFTAKALDREVQDRYILTVLVEDWEHPEWSCEVEVEVTVSDINDNAPTFVSDIDDSTPSLLPEANGIMSVSVPEDARVNSVVAKVEAVDPDLGISGRIRYGLLDADEGHFSIDEREGVVSLVRPLDREVKDAYLLTVQAVDSGVPHRSSSITLEVSVSDVNDNAPEFVHKILEMTVPEDLAVGAEVLRVTATSRDTGINADITYSLHHTTKSRYLAIHPRNGVLSIRKPLDYELVRQVVATVVATDGGTPPLSSTALINLTVTDINDNAPIFALPSYSAVVSEGAAPGDSVLQVRATDEDGGTNSLVRYSISGGDEDHSFQIGETTGIILLAKRLDREKVKEYDLQVEAKDLGSPSQTGVTKVKVTVDDVNDNPPVFANESYEVFVQEHRPAGYTILRLIATDADADADANPSGPPFRWELTEVDPEVGSFTLDKEGSLLLAADELDRRVHSKYMLSVRVWDNGSPPLYAETQVKVIVVEEPQHPPTLLPLNASVSSYLSAFQGGVIGSLTAVDEDPYDTLHFSISTASDSTRRFSYFDVNRVEGTIIALTPLDEGTYRVNVTVSDGKFDSTAEVSVRVLVISDEMIENSVILQVGPLFPSEFLLKHKAMLIKILADQLTVIENFISILSLQPLQAHSQSDEKKTRKSKRNPRGVQQNLDILLVVKQSLKNYFLRSEILEILQEKKEVIRDKLGVPHFFIMDSMCTGKSQCSGHGECVDVVEITSDPYSLYSSKHTSFLSPNFIQKGECLCHEGYGGVDCKELKDVCSQNPCAEYEKCLSSDVSTSGYTCHCPEGKVGPLCDVDLTKCRTPLCYYPLRPVTFKGKSYAQYTVTRQKISSSFVFSVFLRTVHPVGTIMYAAGDIDYSVLEVVSGHIQYRWDCGSGEGLVRVSSFRIDDGEWHFINLTRAGTVSTLNVDGELSSGAAPGVSDILNMNSDFIFLGATIRKDQRSGMSSYSYSSLEFIGCLDQMIVDGVELPIKLFTPTSSGAVLTRFTNIESGCPENLPPAGICGSYPCLNGGTCTEEGKKYKCSCPFQFTGSQCQVDTAPCSTSPCLNGGTCVVVGHSYKCECPPKLSGKRCEYGVFCNPNPCQNGGRCEEGVEGPICKCQHFTGSLCQLDIDECTRNPCQNWGTCLNFFGGFKCICHFNATGEYCSEPVTKSHFVSAFNISVGELISILAAFLLCLATIIAVWVWRKRRQQQKRQQQINEILKNAEHAKNDLLANGMTKRSSKISSVETDQAATQPLRPGSHPHASNDSFILSTLKRLAQLSASSGGHEGLELGTIWRHSHEILHSLNNPQVIPPRASPPHLASYSDPDSLHKPCRDHRSDPADQNSDPSFIPVRNKSCDLVISVDESRFSPSHQSTFSGGSSGRVRDDRMAGSCEGGSEVTGGAAAATPDLLLLPGRTEGAAPAEGPSEGRQSSFTASNNYGTRVSINPSPELVVATPLLRIDARDNDEYLDDDDDDEGDDEDDDHCSFEEIFLASGGSASKGPPATAGAAGVDGVADGNAQSINKVSVVPCLSENDKKGGDNEEGK